MSLIDITQVDLQPEDAEFSDTFLFDIDLWAYQALPSPITWKVIFSSDLTNDDKMEVLKTDEMTIDREGPMSFPMLAPAPDVYKTIIDKSSIPMQEKCWSSITLIGEYKE